MEENLPIIKNLQFDISRFQIKKGGSERSELISKFLERINASRILGGYRPLTTIALNRMISHIPTGQLYPFYKDCERAKNFSAYFFWSIRAQKEVDEKK